MRYIFFILIFVLITTSCKKEDEIVELKATQFVNFGTCFLEYRIDTAVIIIKDSVSYQEFEEELRNPWNPLDFTDSCSSARLPEVDFNDFFVVGKKSQGQGCEASYNRKVSYNKTQQRYIYSLDVNYSGDCATPEIISFNWAIIPKMDNNYAISFEGF